MESLQGKTVTVVGLGLMGGSLALALRPHGVRLVGVDVDEAARRLARDHDVVEQVTASVAEGVQGADLVVLATPVGTILELLEALPPAPYTVLDLGSTKGEICRALSRLPAPISAVGGHPMCGKETAGLTAAEATLYQGKTFVLCRTGRTTAAAEALVLSIVAAIGANPLFLEPVDHDQLVGLVSHLPYFVSALLMAEAAAAAEAEANVWPVSASGFRDTTRLAGSDPRMIRDITLTNRAAIVAQLREYQARLSHLLALLEEGSEAELEAWLAARQREHSLYRAEK